MTDSILFENAAILDGTAEGAVPPAWALGLLIASLVLLELYLTVRDARLVVARSALEASAGVFS